MKITRVKQGERVGFQIGRLQVTASRWPWQPGYDWRGTHHYAPLNAGGARFGGGWRYKLGVEVGGTSVMFNLLYGIVTVRLMPKVKTP